MPGLMAGAKSSCNQKANRLESHCLTFKLSPHLMTINHRIRQSGVLAGLLFITALSSLAADGRIIAIGDVHGDLPDFIAILQQTGLMNESRQWTGGAAVFVQVGDVVDRGPKSRECLDLLM